MKYSQLIHRYVQVDDFFGRHYDTEIKADNELLPIKIGDFELQHVVNKDKLKLIRTPRDYALTYGRIYVYTDQYPLLWLWYWFAVRIVESLKLIDCHIALLLNVWFGMYLGCGEIPSVNFKISKWLKGVLQVGIELRKQVAIACGWTDIEVGKLYPNRCLGTSPEGELGCYVPEYDRSVDAIMDAFDDKGWDWDLEIYTYQGITEYIAVSQLIDYSNSETTGAIALCKLFLEIVKRKES